MLQKAQELAGGNLSAAIIQGMRRFVALREGLMEGQEEITVTVGAPGLQRAKRFIGSKIVEYERPLVWEPPLGSEESATRRSSETYLVYRTMGGRFAVHTRRPASTRGAFFAYEWASNPEDPGGTWREDTEATLDVYESIGQLAGHVPIEVADRVQNAASHPHIEVLDI